MEETPAHSTNLTASHATVKKQTKKVEGCGHKLYMNYMDNFFSNPNFTHLPHKEKSNAVGVPDQIRRACHTALIQENEANRLTLQ